VRFATLLDGPLVQRPPAQFGLLGGHSGIGPNSALSIGVAIATYVQARPTIRINILIARFMVFSFTVRSSWEEASQGGGIIQASVTASSVFCTRIAAIQVFNRLIIKVLDEILLGAVRDLAGKRCGR
jgi:hypothetical protein